MNCLRFFRLAVLSAAALLGLACSKDQTADNRETDYGFVQFKLYKAASYDAGRAESRVVNRLDYLKDAAKINIHLFYGDARISQTLNLAASSNEAAEYGLRSDKLQLLAGEYQVVGYELYDVYDELLYNGAAGELPLQIVVGGLTSYDIPVNVTPRGKARFALYKANIEKGNAAASRADGDFTFDEIAKADITVQNVEVFSERYAFSGLKMKFATTFDENNQSDGTSGYITSVSTCDSLFSLPAGSYRIYEYQLYTSTGRLLDSRRYSGSSVIPGSFSVEDNETTDVRIGINLDLDADYLNDYRALKKIWETLDGPNWYYAGQLFPKGCNWNFNKDIDLWGDQPGVQLHANGRVARIDLSDFGVRGDLPDELGQMTEMVELYLGTHNDSNLLEFDPTDGRTIELSQRSRNRMELHKQYLAARHIAPQMSEPCARGLREHNIVVPETSLYERGYTEAQVIDPKTGLQASSWQLKDVVSGRKYNGIKSIPASIGKLKKLEYLYIANGDIASLPETIGELESLTDLEIYNCPEMKEFPTQIAQLPELVSLNISNNRQWEPAVLRDGLDALANGLSKEKIQILYCTNNRLDEVPESFRNLTKIGLLDLVSNEIAKLHPLGSSVAPVQIYLDDNRIEEFPTENGYFCQMNDMETFSAANNRLTVFPNIFRTNGYTISTIDLSSNRISAFPSKQEFSGVRVTTLTLTNNPIEKFPASLIGNDNSSIAYIVMRACALKEFEKDAFVGKNSAALQSLDLSYNHLTKLPEDFRATNLPYLYGVDLSFNSFSSFPYEPFDAYTLTIFAIRSQRDEQGGRSLKEWPTGVYQHTGLRALYIGSNDLRKINDTISYMIYYLDISDNPNITFDAADICAYWMAGYYYLIYDKTQNILNCAAMLE